MADSTRLTIPGSAFGSEGEGRLRLCHAVSVERIEMALERLGRFVK
jgi:aminotransferase